MKEENDFFVNISIAMCPVVGMGAGLIMYSETMNWSDSVMLAVNITLGSLLLVVIIGGTVEIFHKRRRRHQENLQKEIDAHIKKIEMVCECGAVYSEGATFCARDGKQLTRRIVDNYVWKCPECGKTFSNGEKFCPEHGKELVKSPKE